MAVFKRTITLAGANILSFVSKGWMKGWIVSLVQKINGKNNKAEKITANELKSQLTCFRQK